MWILLSWQRLHVARPTCLGAKRSAESDALAGEDTIGHKAALPQQASLLCCMVYDMAPAFIRLCCRAAGHRLVRNPASW